jgi:ubiquinone/menaquinone biosynthesis C-methylase UbiE
METIMSLPDELLEGVKSSLLSLPSSESMPTEILQTLEASGLATAQLQPTDFGRKLIHCLLSEQKQRGDEFQELMQIAHYGRESRVLDVGCGVGALLRFLARLCPALESIGVDKDAAAVAWAARVAQKKGIAFCLGSADSLPFRDKWFTHVICRNAITYMHQRRAIRELCRVLKPNGYLCLRFYTVRCDLHQLYLHVCRLQDCRALPGTLGSLFFGSVNELSGWQPIRHGSLWGRAFASVRGISAILKEHDCAVVHVEESRGCPKFWGASTQTSLLARKLA